MHQHRTALARLLSIAGLVLGGVATAAAEDLEGFTLRDWNKMACSPQTLRAGAVLNVMLPRKPSDYVSILAPTGRFLFLVYPGPVVDRMPSAEALRSMTVLHIDTMTAKGLETNEPEPVFIESGSYTVLVGRQFETERPIVDGWCRAIYLADD